MDSRGADGVTVTVPDSDPLIPYIFRNCLVSAISTWGAGWGEVISLSVADAMDGPDQIPPSRGR